MPVFRVAAAAALATFTTHPAAAGPDRMSILLGSYHASPGQEFEEFNPGLFLTWKDALWDGRLDASIGAFRNSYGRGAVAATAALPLYETPSVEISAFLGAAYYPEDGRTFRVHLGDVVPLGGLQALVGPVFFQAIPGDGREADAVFTFGLSIPLRGALAD